MGCGSTRAERLKVHKSISVAHRAVAQQPIECGGGLVVEAERAVGLARYSTIKEMGPPHCLDLRAWAKSRGWVERGLAAEGTIPSWCLV